MNSKLYLLLIAALSHFTVFSQIESISFVQVADHDGVYSDGVDLSGYKTFDVYVHSANASDILMSVFSTDDDTPGVADAQDTRFDFTGNVFQHEMAGFTASENDCSLWDANPTMEFDSYITFNDTSNCELNNPFVQEWILPDSITTRSAFEGPTNGDYFDGGNFWTDEGKWHRECIGAPSFGPELKYRVARITTNQSFTGSVQAKTCCTSPVFASGVTYPCVDTVVVGMDTTYVVCSLIPFECDFDFCENAIDANVYNNPPSCTDPWGGSIFWSVSSENGEVSYEADCGWNCGSGTGDGTIWDLPGGTCYNFVFTDEAGCQAFVGGCVYMDDWAEAWVTSYSESVCEGESNGFICLGSNLEAGWHSVDYNLVGPDGSYEDQCNYDLPCGEYNIYVDNGVCFTSSSIEIECEDCCNIEGCMDESACNFDPSADCDDDSCTYPGCTDPLACNYNSNAGCDSGSCMYDYGCTDPGACNYDAFANCDDGSCTYPGCLEDWACNYDPNAGCDDGSCLYFGCTEPEACNYDPSYGCDDGSCVFPSCVDISACNYDEFAECDGGDCTYPGCTDPTACNYSSSAGCDDGSCILPDGCDDPSACNYDELATCNDGSCSYYGCTEWWACNYDPLAGCDDGSCTYFGCTDPDACNYDPFASCDDLLCEFESCAGCTDPGACNFDLSVWIDDGTCTYPGCTDLTACNYDISAGCDDGSCILPDGCTDPTACNYDELATCDDGSCYYETCPTCPGDADLNGHVNVLDLLSISVNYGCTSGCFGHGDANFDGLVDVLDLIAVTSNYAMTCP